MKASMYLSKLKDSVKAHYGCFGKTGLNYFVQKGYENPLLGIYTEKEYQLIQQKKSDLPRMKRDLVVFAFENEKEFAKMKKDSEKKEKEIVKNKLKGMEKIVKKGGNVDENA